MTRVLRRITHPPAKTPEQRQKQIAEGIVPDFGRGSCGGMSPLPYGAGWLPHIGRQQRMRMFNQAWARFEKKCSTDEHYRATRERLLDWLVKTNTVEAELAAKAIVYSCFVRSEEQKAKPTDLTAPPMVAGKEWVDIINAQLNEWESNAQPCLTEEATSV